MRIFFLVTFIIINLNIFGQTKNELDSFKYIFPNSFNNDWVKIQMYFKNENGEIKFRQDSIEWFNPKINTIINRSFYTGAKFLYKFDCLNYLDFKKCYSDSILLYFPLNIETHDKAKFNKDDIFSIGEYSKILLKLNEPILFNKKDIGPVVRIIFSNDSTFFLLNLNKTNLHYKQLNIYKDFITNDLIEESSIEKMISKRTINNLILLNNKDLNLDLSPKNLIIETYVDGKYNYIFVNKNEFKIQYFSMFNKIKKIMNKYGVLDF